MVGSTPQDMTQFYRIFGTIRRPALPIDTVSFADQPENQPNHICVVRNNNVSSSTPLGVVPQASVVT